MMNKTAFQFIRRYLGRWLIWAAALVLLATIPGCVTRVIKNNSVTAQLQRAAGNGPGWYVNSNSKSNSSGHAHSGFTRPRPGSFIFGPSQPH